MPVNFPPPPFATTISVLKNTSSSPDTIDNEEADKSTVETGEMQGTTREIIHSSRTTATASSLYKNYEEQTAKASQKSLDPKIDNPVSAAFSAIAEASNMSPAEFAKEISTTAAEVSTRDVNLIVEQFMRTRDEIEKTMVLDQAYLQSIAGGNNVSLASSLANEPPSPVSIYSVGETSTEPRLTEEQKAISNGFMQKYFGGLTNEDTERANITALRPAVDEAAVAFSKVGCNSFAQADRLLNKALMHDKIHQMIGASLAGGGGYALGSWVFSEKIAPHLPQNVLQQPALVGLIAGLFIGSLHTGLSTPFGAASNSLMYRGNSKNIAALDNLQPSFGKAVAVNSSVSALWTGLKNLSRVAAPPIMNMVSGPLKRTVVGTVDFALDAGGGFLSSTISKAHSNKILNKHQAATFLMQEDLEDKLKKAAEPNSVKSFAEAAGTYMKSFAAALPKAATPSNLAATVFIAGAVSTLFYSNSLVSAAHKRDGFPEDEMSPSEAWQRAMVSTAMMSMLAGGATAIGMSTSKYVDPKVKEFVGKYADMFVEKLRALAQNHDTVAHDTGAGISNRFMSNRFINWMNDARKRPDFGAYPAKAQASESSQAPILGISSRHSDTPREMGPFPEDEVRPDGFSPLHPQAPEPASSKR